MNLSQDSSEVFEYPELTPQEYWDDLVASKQAILASVGYLIQRGHKVTVRNVIKAFGVEDHEKASTLGPQREEIFRKYLNSILPEIREIRKKS